MHHYNRQLINSLKTLQFYDKMLFKINFIYTNIKIYGWSHNMNSTESSTKNIKLQSKSRSVDVETFRAIAIPAHLNANGWNQRQVSKREKHEDSTSEDSTSLK